MVVLEYVLLLFTRVLKISSIYIGLKYNKNELGAKKYHLGLAGRFESLRVKLLEMCDAVLVRVNAGFAKVSCSFSPS